VVKIATFAKRQNVIGNPITTVQNSTYSFKRTDMKNKISRTIFLALLSVTLFECNNDNVTNTVKLYANDPFKNTIVHSQPFDIDAKQDNVIEGEKGTIIVCPKGCFKNSKGEIIEENIKIELSEAFSLHDMLLSNLTTTSDGKLLETDGMIYFNASANGEQLTINKDIPIHIEIPTTEKKIGMEAYKGIRDEKGNMNWIKPIELDKFLITVDINSLDFLPEGFQAEVDKGMPYKKYKTATQSITDSLYYNLSVTDGSNLLKGLVPTNYNEPYYNKNKQFVNGKNSNIRYYLSEQIEMNEGAGESDSSKSNCGIDPAIIKVLKSEKYQNTFIATKEFETRLKVIFKTCNNEVLETYIKNLDKNLYEVDSIASIIVGKSQYQKYFVNFSKQRLTKIKEADKHANLLKGYFKKQLAIIKSELEKGQEKLMKNLNKENEEAQKVADDYKNLLQKRENYRMETYGFNWTETGWINIDNGTLPKDWDEQPLEIIVNNGKQFDRVYTYVIYTSIKSLYRLNTRDNERFYVGNEADKNMLMPKKKLGIAIAVGYKNEIPSISIKEFETGSQPKFSITLAASNIEKVKEAISPYEKYAKENEVSKDIEFMAKFYKEEQRQKELRNESEFIYSLYNIAFPCCNDDSIGEELFIKNCSSCHRQDNRKLVGPGLAYSTTKYSKQWLIKWTLNSQALIKSGDKDAIKIYNDHNKSVQPSFNLSEKEVLAIYNYIDNYNRKLK
jgi:mono/diheme cytochrome c family protein